MAKSKVVYIDEEYLWCTICLEPYQRPRTLPCQHSFCEDCLQEYLTKFSDTSHLLCPTCRVNITKPYGITSVKKWVSTIPINFTLMSLVENRRDIMDKEQFCEPCVQRKKEVQPTMFCIECCEKMCNQCMDDHKTFSMAKKHTAIDISTETDYPDKCRNYKLLVSCPDHPSKKVKFFCKDDNSHFCSECAILKHRKCTNLTSIVDQAKMYNSEGKINLIKERLNTIENDANVLLKYEEEQTKRIDESKQQVKISLDTLKKKFTDTYQLIESRVSENADILYAEESRKVSQQSKDIESLLEDIKLTKNQLETAHDIGQETETYMVAVNTQENAEKFFEQIKKLYASSNCNILQLDEKTPVDCILESLMHGIFVWKKNISRHLPMLLCCKESDRIMKTDSTTPEKKMCNENEMPSKETIDSYSTMAYMFEKDEIHTKKGLEMTQSLRESQKRENAETHKSFWSQKSVPDLPRWKERSHEICTKEKDPRLLTVAADKTMSIESGEPKGEGRRYWKILEATETNKSWEQTKEGKVENPFESSGKDYDCGEKQVWSMIKSDSMEKPERKCMHEREISRVRLTKKIKEKKQAKHAHRENNC